MYAHYAFILSFKKRITLHSLPFIWFGFVLMTHVRSIIALKLHFFRSYFVA